MHPPLHERLDAVERLGRFPDRKPLELAGRSHRIIRHALYGVRVNAVCPGPIDTPMLPLFFGRADDHQDAQENHRRLMAMVPMGRLGRPREIAHAAMWLLSDDASYITGVVLPVDGGYPTR